MATNKHENIGLRKSNDFFFLIFMSNPIERTMYVLEFHFVLAVLLPNLNTSSNSESNV